MKGRLRMGLVASESSRGEMRKGTLSTECEVSKVCEVFEVLCGVFKMK